MPVKQRDRRGLIPSSCVKIAPASCGFKGLQAVLAADLLFLVCCLFVRTFCAARIVSVSYSCGAILARSRVHTNVYFCVLCGQSLKALGANLNVLHRLESSEGTVW